MFVRVPGGQAKNIHPRTHTLGTFRPGFVLGLCKDRHPTSKDAPECLQSFTPLRKIPGYPAGIPATAIPVCRVRYLANAFPFGYPRSTRRVCLTTLVHCPSKSVQIIQNKNMGSDGSLRARLTAFLWGSTLTDGCHTVTTKF